MRFVVSKQLLAVAGCAAALTAATVPTAASADVVWTVNGTFDDGGTVSGFFDIDVYGYVDGFNLQTAGGSTDAGFDYDPSDSYFSNGTFYVDAQPGYQSDLHLEFADNLTVASADNAIQGGEGGPSWECQNSYSCYLPADGSIRYIATGFASAGGVPEPAAWALMILGFGGVGAMLRNRRRPAIAVA